MATKRLTRRVKPGPAQCDLFGQVGLSEPASEAPRASFVDPSPEALTVGPQSLRSYLEGSPLQEVFEFRALIRELDLGPFFERYEATGRAPYHPALMLGLVLFALTRGVRSLRQIETLARENVCAWWLTGGACPDHASIGRFVDRFGDLISGYAFEALTAKILRKTGTSGTDLAGDGTTIASVASRFKLVQEEAAREKAAELRTRAEAAGAAARQRMEQKAEKYERAADAAQRERKRTGHKPKKRSVKVAVTDPEATHQRLKNGFPAPSYKPTILANKARIVVAHDVQSSSENEAVDGLCAQAKRVNGIGRIDTIRLDAGFFSGDVLQTLLDHDVENPLVTGSGLDGELRGKKAAKRFPKTDFTYDLESDTYTCPAGKTLRCVKNRQARKIKIYGDAPCSDCPLRERCTSSKSGRQIYRYEQSDLLKDAMRSVLENPLARADYAKRSAMVEPVFADFLQCNRFTRFLRAGLAKARTDVGILALAHNVSRYLAWARGNTAEALERLVSLLRQDRPWLRLGRLWALPADGAAAPCGGPGVATASAA